MPSYEGFKVDIVIRQLQLNKNNRFTPYQDARRVRLVDRRSAVLQLVSLLKVCGGSSALPDAPSDSLLLYDLRP